MIPTRLVTVGVVLATFPGGAVDSLGTRGVGRGGLLGKSAAIELRRVVVHDAAVDTVGVLAVGAVGLLGRLLVHGVAGVGGINVRLDTLAVAGVALHNLLVLLERSDHVLVGYVVEEDARTEGRGDGGTELAVTGLEDGGGGLLKEVLVELVVVHGQTDLGEQVENALVVAVADLATDVGKGGGICHVDGNGVTVTEGSLGDELVERGPGVTVLPGMGQDTNRLHIVEYGHLRQ